MFKCQFSGKIVGPKIAPVTIVVKVRPKSYVNDVHGELVTSKGWEVVKELKVAPSEVENCKTHYNLK